MSAIKIPCPTCSGTRTTTHEDRHTETRMDICPTCKDEGTIPARTGETREASFGAGAQSQTADHILRDALEWHRGRLFEPHESGTGYRFGDTGNTTLIISNAEARAILSTAPTATAGGGGERVRHLKRGTEYEVLGEAEAQVSGSTCPDGIGNGVLPKSRILREGRVGYESDRLIVYRCATTGKLWCRFTDEFRDGRFQTISQAPAEQAPAGEESLQARYQVWMDKVCEGDPTDLKERCARAAEEFFELMQALHVPASDLREVMQYTYGRPEGTPFAELGGAISTLAALAEFIGLDMMACGEAELARVDTLAMIAKVRGKRSRRHGRGALPGLQADLIPTSTDAQPKAASPVGNEALREALLAKAEGQVAYWRKRQAAEKSLEEGLSEDGLTYTSMGDQAAWQSGYCNGRMSEADWWLQTLFYLSPGCKPPAPSEAVAAIAALASFVSAFEGVATPLSERQERAYEDAAKFLDEIGAKPPCPCAACRDARDRAALASHPTTGQETVATPRDGRVREALAILQRANRSGLLPGCMMPDGAAPCDAFSEFDTAIRDAIAVLSAPGSAGPGDREDGLLATLPPDIVSDCENQALNLANLWTNGNEGARTCILAALLRIHAGYASPHPAREPNTGDTGEGWRGIEVDEARIAAWVADRFGPESLNNTLERADRLLEEAIEIQQAVYAEAGVALGGHTRAAGLVAHVYSKTPGDPRQEVGGVGTCALALCRRLGVRMDLATQAELTRFEGLSKAHFDKRHQAKVDAGVAAQHDRPTPATPAETRGPAGQTKGGL